MTFTWVVFYNTWICKEASSLFLAHHPYDILKSKQVNILVTYWSWMKRLFQHWICSRTHHHSLQIFQQFLHNNLASTRPSGDKKVLLETQQSFFLKKFSFSLQTSNAKKKQQQQQKHLTSNRQIRLYSLFFTDKNVQFSTVFPAKIGLCLLLIIPCIDIQDKGPSWTVSLTG